jgi:hypothetical protein
MNIRRMVSFSFAISSSLAALALSPREAAAQTAPAHLFWAEEIALNVLPGNNTYGTSPHYITWAGEGGATEYTNRTQCNSFLTRVLERGYGWTDTDIRLWLGSTSPSAVMYHDAVVAGNGFATVATLSAILPGDVLAIRYPAGGSVSGHIATVVSAPVLYGPAAPWVAGTYQYAVTVVDSSNSGHGPTDTRLAPGGTWNPGAGIGVMRLYVDAQGAVAGHTWSTSTGSTYYGQATRHLVIGRLVVTLPPEPPA